MAGLYGVLSQLVGYRGAKSASAWHWEQPGKVCADGAAAGIDPDRVGLAVGIAIAFPAERLIKSFLYQVPALDAWTYAAVIVALPTVGDCALLPARKAASIQPMQA